MINLAVRTPVLFNAESYWWLSSPAASSRLESSVHKITAEKGDLCYARKLLYRFSLRLYTLDTSCDSAGQKQDVHPACPLTSQSLHNLSLTLSHTHSRAPPSVSALVDSSLWLPISPQGLWGALARSLWLELNSLPSAHCRPGLLCSVEASWTEER